MPKVVILLWFSMHPLAGFEAGHINGVYQNAEACALAKIENQKRRSYEMKGDIAYPIEWYCSEFPVK